MKRMLIFIVALVMLAVGFAGCQQRDETPDPTVTIVPTARPAVTDYPDGDMNMSPTIGPDGRMPSPTPMNTPRVAPDTSPEVAPGTSPAVSPSPNVNQDR